jgi:hypothetical protein
MSLGRRLFSLFVISAVIAIFIAAGLNPQDVINVLASIV